MNLETLTLPLQVDDSGWNKAIGAATATVGALVAAMGLAIKSTFDWADSMDQLQDVMGITNEQAAALSYTARVAGVDVGKLSSANTILAKGLVDAKGKLDVTGKALKKYGINVKDANGQVKDQAQLIDEISKKYNELGTQTERVNFLTEIYGRSGGELVDFFDTLAKQGGIDAVTEKVKSLGLAIDPNKYEQFNRNLEELKLIGLSLAIAFTEKVMPMAEKFVEWIMNLAQSPEFKSIADGIRNFVDTAIEWFGKIPSITIDDILAIDWGMISQNMIDGINSVDWAALGDTIITTVMTWLDNAANVLVDIVTETDWVGLGNSLASAFNNFWAGMLGTNEAGLQAMVQEKINSISGADVSPVGNKGAELGMAFYNGVKTGFGKLVADLNAWFSNVWNTVTRWMQSISNEFARIAGSWIVNATYMLNLRLKGFYAFLQKMVDMINQIISKIIPININLPNLPGMSAGNTGGGGNRRASGGPVIAGQPYQVAEFFRPETFTPNANGRVDPTKNVNNNNVTVEIDYRKMVKAFRDAQLLANA